MLGIRHHRARAGLLASASLLAMALGSARAGVIDFPDGSDDTGILTITDNVTQLRVLTGESATQSGGIDNDGTARPIEKIGGGTLTLSGFNLYGGATTISAGTLILDNSFASVGSSDYTVAGGATLTLDSLGFYNVNTLSGSGTVQFNNGAILSFGNGGAGTLSSTFSGTLTGSGELEVTGGGVLTLDGNVTHSLDAVTLCNCSTGGLTLSAGTMNAGNTYVESGTLTVKSGAQWIANELTVLGTMVVEDADVQAAAATAIGNGFSGPALLSIVNGGTLESQFGASVDSDGSSSTGVVTLTGAGSQWSVGNAELAIGLSSAGIVNVADGAVLTATSGLHIYSGTLNIGGGALGGSVSVSSFFTNDGSIIGDFTDTVELSDDIDGTGSVQMQGAGTLFLSGANSFSGGITALAGIIRLGDDTAAGTNDINLTSGGLGFANGVNVANLVFLNDATSQWQVLGTAEAEFSGDILDSFGTAAFEKTGTGTLTLSGSAAYDGSTTISAGTLRLTSGFAAVSTSDYTVAGGATLALDGAFDTFAINTLSGEGTVQFGGFSILSVGDSGFGTASSTFTGILTTPGPFDYGELEITGGGVLTLDGNVTHSLTEVTFCGCVAGGGLTLKNGTMNVLDLTDVESGTLTVSDGAQWNTFDLYAGGAVVVDNARLDASGFIGVGDPFVSDSTLTIRNGAVVTAADGVGVDGDIILNVPAAITIAGTGSRLEVSGFELEIGDLSNGTVTVADGGALAATDGLYIGLGGVLNIGSGAAGGTVSAPDYFTNDGRIVADFTGNVSLDDDIDGSGTLTKQGAGTLTLNGNNSFTGGITVAAGALELGSSTAAGGGAITTTGSTIIYGNGVDIANMIIVSSDTTKLSVAPGFAAIQSGDILDDGNDRPIEKIGAGTLSLIGANNYGGATRVSQGDLVLLAAQSSVGRSDYTVAAGATLTLDSSETYNINSLAGGGTVQFTNGATLEIGNSGLGTTSTTFSGTLSGGSLTVGGTGVLTLSGNVVHGLDDVVLCSCSGGGITQTAGTTNLTGSVFVDGGTLRLSGTAHWNTTNLSVESSLAVDSGALLQIGGYAFIGSSTKAAQVTVDGGAIAGNGDVYVQSDFSQPAASVTITNNGAWTILGGTLVIGGSDHGVVTVRDGGSLQVVGAMLNIASGGLLNIGGGGTFGSVSSTGAFVNFGQIAADFSGSGTLANDISGSGDLVKSGSGTLILTGANTYTRGATINAGTLQVGNGGTSGSFLGDITVDGGALVFNRSDDSTYAGELFGGGGSLIKRGAGTLILAQNSYGFNGTASVEAGALMIGNGGITGHIETGVDIAAGAQLIYNLSNGATLDFDISGGGALVQQGSGSLNLSGRTNTHTGGTTVSAGFLIIGQDANLGGANGGLTVNGGTLQTLGTFTLGAGRTVTIASASTINSFGGVTITGVLAGNGQLTKDAPGFLRLTGNSNSFSGNVVVSAGSLIIGDGGTNGALDADITDNADVTFNRSDSLTYSKLISGSGRLTQAGSGTLTLTGASSFSGQMRINAGTLMVNGSLASSSFTFSAIGTLAGTGTVGATNLGFGTITPGSGLGSTGTLTINGNLTMTAGTYVAEIAPGAADKIMVNGTANLAGTLLANFAIGTWAPGQYTLLTATGVVSGTFGTFNTLGLPTGFRADASYDAHNLFVTLTPLDFIWKTAPVSTDWNTAANWFYGYVPTAGYAAQFGASSGRTVVVSQASSAASLLFKSDAPTYNLDVTGTAGGAASLTLAGGGIVDDGSFAPSITVSGVSSTNKGTLIFAAGGNAADAVLTAGSFGSILFQGTSNAGANARLVAQSGGVIDFSATMGAASDYVISAGSIAGAGSFILGAGTLSAGGLGAATEVSGVISGNGGRLTKTGSGTLILSGANTYTGGTIISAGTLQVGNGGTTGSVTGNIDDHAALVFNRSDTFSFGGSISGPGTVTKLGGGTLIFTGSNIYGGVTTISAGTLQIGNGGSTGSLGTGNVVNNSNLTFNRSASPGIQFDGAISGTGSLTQNGAGSLVLNGANTYSGVTTINSGDLQVGTNGNTGSLGSGNVVNNAKLVLSRSDTFTFANSVSGSGGVTISGIGTIILTGANSYSGSTIIQGGVLQIGNGGTSGTLGTGTVVNDAVLAFNRSDALTYAGVISGSGSLQHTGSGTTTLTGASTYAGATTISAGTLVVNGSITSTVTLAGGTLKGSGTVGGINVGGGTLAPGNSIGTLNTGTISFGAGSTYQVEINDAGQSDLINVTGLATLNGAVQVVSAAGVYAPVTTYRIINAGSISGAFTSVTSLDSALTPSLIYGANSVDLRVLRNNFSFGTAYGVTPNQIAAGGGVSAGGGGTALYAALANAYAPGTINASLDSLSGEIHASLRSAMIEDGRMIRDAVLDRLAAARDTGIWAQGFADYGELESDGNAGEMHRSHAGFIAGFDLKLGDGFRAGLAGAYAQRHVGVAARASSASGNAGHVIGYGGWQGGAWHVDMGGAFGWGSDSVMRGVAVFAETERASQDSRTGQFFARASYDLPDYFASPYIGLAHVSATTGAFAESGGLARLSGGEKTDSQTYSAMGVRFAAPALDLNGLPLNLHADLGWSHALEARVTGQTVRFAGTGQSFAVLGVPVGSEAATVQLGLDLAITPATVFSFGYDGSLSSRGSSHAIRGGLDWRL